MFQTEMQVHASRAENEALTLCTRRQRGGLTYVQPLSLNVFSQIFVVGELHVAPQPSYRFSTNIYRPSTNQTYIKQ